MTKVVKTFVFSEPKKNSVLYRERLPDGRTYEEWADMKQCAVGSLYVQKSVLGPNPPKELKVTIEAA